ncbi:endonuclease Q family protein [Gracilibacillus sp. S3-1-1]|uniref:Endonuclease Q family protein n=1 Tax=Gracilibacillus pellucidus TaxID=3095368 RepID=A0ACC6M520_9BACI|nr:endonuclease Q family protein [Gracilibacillus sp. S3-1-1]MDX8046063.1 endonuclease Q family protein [Gracilibacillus sp. S3-1-1]
MLKNYFADLHIHIGRNIKNKPVKITASKDLTLTKIMKEASERKGIDIVGIIDCHAPTVCKELEKALEEGIAYELDDGGIQFNQTTLILGSEIEIYDKHCKGPIHVLCYFPYLQNMKEFSKWLTSRMKNVELSSQRYYGEAVDLQAKTAELEGLFIPAHVFTPFKSLYGKGVSRSLTEVLNRNLIDAVELGLSSDTEMADQIDELRSFTYLTNSDAHSLAKIAREYQQVLLQSPSFLELKKALKNEQGRKIVANYGMNPKLGKYYRTVCASCLSPYSGEQCDQCGSVKFIKGVSERIGELASESNRKLDRPAYTYQVPLEFLPKLGPKTLDKLLDHFGTEMNVIHRVPLDELEKVVGAKLANMIIQMREGSLLLNEGGGGRYGTIKD